MPQTYSGQKGVPSELMSLYAGAPERRCCRKTASSCGAPEPGEAETDAAGPVSTTESIPSVELLEEVGWATVVVEFCGARADSVGTAKSEANSLSFAEKSHPRPGERSTVVKDAETRATNILEGAERLSTLICGLCL